MSHIPGSVVLQDELTEILDDYPLTTEMNEALAGKAALQHTHAIADVTNLQNALNSKWEWNASQVAGVKVNSAFAADKLASSVKINGTDFNGESDIITARWGSARTITVWDFYNVNKQASQGIDGSANISLKLPQSIKVKTLSIDGVTLSVVGGRLHVDSTLTADGDLVAYGDGDGSSGGGLDEEAMWAALGGSMSSKVISPSHLPSLSSLSGNLDSSRITGLDSALTSYAKKDGSNATGTWPVSISGNAATADISNYLFLNPNNGTHASQNDAVPANGRFAIYDVNTATTAGGSDGYIMAFRWPSGNFATQVFLDADDTGIMALRHRNNSNVWTDWYRILHSGNIGSYALTPSNYTSTLDSRYVNVSGDTMTGNLKFSTDSFLQWDRNTDYFYIGFKNTSDADTDSYAWFRMGDNGNEYFKWQIVNGVTITDVMTLKLDALRFKGNVVWHSGNDGSGSGLDADLLDGYHASRYTRCQGAYNYITFTVGGDANTYYPVHIHSVSDYYPSTLVNITRRYNEAAPNTWNTATHRGGLTLCILWNNSVYWDGNGAGNPFQRVLECVQTYSTMVGGLDTSHYNGGGMVVWLRGGGAVYHVYSDQGTELSVSVYLSSFTDSANRTFAPTTTPKSIDSWRQLDIKASSATKLANSRTLWGRPFDGMENVSGDMTGVGCFTGVGRFKYGASDESDATYGKYHRLNLGYHSIDHTDFYEQVFNFYSNGGGTTWAKIGSTNYFNGNVGIGTASPAYKLDVAGTLRASGLITASAGVQVGSTDDYGWYIYSSRICAGVGVARGVNAGSLLVSSAWADYTKVPTNGIYSKGDIITGGRLFIPSSEGNDKYYIRIE